MRAHSQQNADFTSAHVVRFVVVAPHAQVRTGDSTSVKRTSVWGAIMAPNYGAIRGDYGTPAT